MLRLQKLQPLCFHFSLMFAALNDITLKYQNKLSFIDTYERLTCDEFY